MSKTEQHNNEAYMNLHCNLFKNRIVRCIYPSSRGIAFPRKQTLTETARNSGSKQRTTFQPGSVFRSMKNAQK